MFVYGQVLGEKCWFVWVVKKLPTLSRVCTSIYWSDIFASEQLNLNLHTYFAVSIWSLRSLLSNSLFLEMSLVRETKFCNFWWWAKLHFKNLAPIKFTYSFCNWIPEVHSKIIGSVWKLIKTLNYTKKQIHTAHFFEKQWKI